MPIRNMYSFIAAKGGNINGRKGQQRKQLEEELFYQAPNVLDARPELKDEAWAYCEGVPPLFESAKTEREFIEEAVILLKQAVISAL